MSLPSFPKDPQMSTPNHNHHSGSYETSSSGISIGGGAGNLLPKALLIVCGVCSAIATLVSFWSIYLQLKSYRRPLLQRCVVRIMLMVPLYAIASIIALFSLDAAFFIDTVRDLYEAFVIYMFFQLLVSYLGGERSLLILLHGRQPIPHPFPFNIFLSPMDISDPWVLLNLKRGILQYVQIKPLLVLATVILKVTNTYREGDFAFDSGYTYVSVIYNGSICLSLYCLAMFWVCVSKDLKPFRPVPKFLCVKGILFFSFWQGLAVSLLVAIHAIKRLGAYTDNEHMSLALTDSLVCLEMPFFAIAHQYAFQASDYIDESLVHCARMPFFYALRDAFGTRDVWEDSKATLKGRGVSYQAYEPAEGVLHVGDGRMRRIRAGLRYTKGGTQKYWIQQPGDEGRARPPGPINKVRRDLQTRVADREGYAPLLPKQTARILHHSENRPYESDSDTSDAPSLDFEGAGPEDQWEESMYSRAKKIEYIGYPNVDVSREKARRKLWEEEDGVLAGKFMRKAHNVGQRILGHDEEETDDEASSKASPKDHRTKGKDDKKKRGVYGQWANDLEQDRNASSNSASSSSRPTPKGGDPQRSPKTLADVRLEADDSQADDWLYDGDNEDPQAWRPEDDDGNHLRVTRRGDRSRGPSPVSRHHHLTPPRSPFELGEADNFSDPEEDEVVKGSDRPLPSDAVDLIVDDQEAVQEAQKHERQKGDPNAHVINHVYVPGDQDSATEDDDESTGLGTSPEDHRQAAIETERHIQEDDIVREVEPPRILADLQHVDDNPWK